MISCLVSTCKYMYTDTKPSSAFLLVMCVFIRGEGASAQGLVTPGHKRW
jgi:hypothetical protein